MKVRMRQLCAGPAGVWQPGQVVNVAPPEAAALVKAGAAEALEPAPALPRRGEGAGTGTGMGAQTGEASGAKEGGTQKRGGESRGSGRRGGGRKKGAAAQSEPTPPASAAE